MNRDLERQQEQFKKSLQNQPVIERKVAASTQLNASATNSSIESLSEELRFDDGSQRHVNSYVHAIISFIKTFNRRVSFAEIKERLNIELEAIEGLLDKISRNERISIFDSSLAYNHVYKVSNAVDLIDVLKQNFHSNGLLVQELRESCPSIDSIIKEMMASNELVVIKGKDDQPRTVFLNPLPTHKSLDDGFKQLWASQTVPIGDDLGLYLVKVGLKGSVTAAGKATAPPQPKLKPSRSANRRIKITNTHIEGIDFSVDLPSNNSKK